jgi:hypothetical protein
MKQKMAVKTQNAESKCNTKACNACQSCKAVEFDVVRQKTGGDSLQLYAREAENYFFHYAFAIKQYN